MEARTTLEPLRRCLLMRGADWGSERLVALTLLSPLMSRNRGRPRGGRLGPLVTFGAEALTIELLLLLLHAGGVFAPAVVFSVPTGLIRIGLAERSWKWGVMLAAGSPAMN
jgi:hypothetical protein